MRPVSPGLGLPYQRGDVTTTPGDHVHARGRLRADQPDVGGRLADHPRPRIVAASGASGHLTVKDDEIITPLVYSTELARSVSLGSPVAISYKDANNQTQRLDGAKLEAAKVEYLERLPGALQPRKGQRTLRGPCVVAGLIYGLVNVRTDGDTILSATMNEGKADWTVKKITSRF